MDNQQEQKNQNPNQEVEYISAFLDEDEEVNESIGEQKKAGNLAETQHNKAEEEPKKPKRSRKTLEQEIAELDAKRERLIEKKRRQEAHEKIVFGAICIKVFEVYSESDKNGWNDWKLRLNSATSDKDRDILNKIINDIEKQR